MAEQFLRFSNGMVFPGGDKIQLTIETKEGTNLEVSMQSEELQDIIQYFALLAVHSPVETTPFRPGKQPDLPRYPRRRRVREEVPRGRGRVPRGGDRGRPARHR